MPIGIPAGIDEHPAKPRLTVFVLERQTVLRECLTHVLEHEADLEVVGGASDPQAVTTEADVIVTGLVFGRVVRPEVVGDLRARFPRAAILVLSAVDEPEAVAGAMAAGARGYVLMEATSSEVVEAVRRVAAGQAYLQPSLGAAFASRPVPRGTHLSPREIDVLELIADGHTNREIAGLLGIGLRTVESHRTRITEKLGLRTRSELVHYAMVSGLLHVSQH